MFSEGDVEGELVPAPGLEGVAGSFIEVSLHGDPIWCVRFKIHDGVIIGHILEIFKQNKSIHF